MVEQRPKVSPDGTRAHDIRDGADVKEPQLKSGVVDYVDNIS